MENKPVQSSLFIEGIDYEQPPRTLAQMASRRVLLIEELRVGEWDYNRLIPVRKKYEDTVKRWRGITRFQYSQNKFDCIEARMVIGFLKSWQSRAENLRHEIKALEMEISKLSE